MTLRDRSRPEAHGCLCCRLKLIYLKAGAWRVKPESRAFAGTKKVFNVGKKLKYNKEITQQHPDALRTRPARSERFYEFLESAEIGATAKHSQY